MKVKWAKTAKKRTLSLGSPRLTPIPSRHAYILSHLSLVRKNLCLFPVSQYETDSDAVDVVVVIKHALTIAIKVLNVSAYSL